MSVAVVPARRRKPRVSGDSEEFSEDSYDDNDANKGSEGDTDLNASSEGLRESEYETLDEAGESESDETTAIDDEREEELSDSVIIEYEREEGDGQESVPPKEKKLDDDEDRRNPQYIPKRGTFYEHDDRTAVEDAAEETVEKESERTKETEKKKVWKEQENRWSHDRYNEDDQAPKSRDELIAIYGYDIRNEDAPPRARRRRKYGRGPNKYTRNWEDEDAYGKPGGIVLRGGGIGRRGGGRGGPRKPFGSQPMDSEEEFPPLNNTTSGRGFKSDGGTSKTEVAPSSQMRGTNRSSYRGRRSGSFQSQSREGIQSSENKEVVSKDETSTTSSNGAPSANNAWKTINSQNKVESVKVRDDIKKPIRDKSLPRSSNANSNSYSKSRPMGDEKKEKLEENGWKPRRDRSKPRTTADDSPVVDASGGNSGWRGKSRGDRRGLQNIPVESLTFTPSATRGRGRGQRGGMNRQPIQFKPGMGSDKIVPPSRRSLSETRVTSHDQGSGAEGPYIKSQVVNRTTDDMVKELSRVTISEHQPQISNRDYTRKPTKNSNNYHQVPPRMQESAANKPKRYSSQRQRSLPETGVTAAAAAAAAAAAVAAYAPPHGFYPPAGYAQPPEELEGMGVVSSGYVQPPPVYGEAQQQPPPPPVVAQPPATTPPLGLLPPPHPQPPPAYATPPFSSPPTFIPPPVAGPPPRILPPAATYMTAAPTGAPIINYVATPPQNQFAPQAYAPFQGFTAVPAAQPPPELYQPQGITYYSPEEQIMARPITQKRQSTAIPIVPPPEKGPRGRGRLREETSVGQSSPGIIDVGAAGDASSAGLKMTQVEDAADSKKNEPELQEVYEEPNSSECVEENSKEVDSMGNVQSNSVSPNIINEINITEIPESAEAMEAAKSIEAAAIKSSEITDTSLDTPLSSTETIKTVVESSDEITVSTSETATTSNGNENSEANIPDLNTSSTEQEIQA